MRLEQALLEFYPDYELEPKWQEYKGLAQGILLDGLDTARLTLEASERLEEFA